MLRFTLQICVGQNSIRKTFNTLSVTTRGVSVGMVLLESRLEDKRNQSNRDEEADN